MTKPKRPVIALADRDIGSTTTMPESETITPVTDNQVLALLIAQWPNAFSATSPKPLALGIHREVLRNRLAGTSQRSVRTALFLYVNGTLYLKALAAPGAQRVDLTGAIVEPVREEDAAHAARRIKERRRHAYNRAKKKHRTADTHNSNQVSADN